MKRILRIFLVAVMLTGINLSAKDLKALTIGNSFADSVYVYLPSIVGNAGCPLLIERANLPGCSLQRHRELAERSGSEPELKPYKKKNLREMLTSEKWYVVTLQQASPFSWQADSYYPYLENLPAEKLNARQIPTGLAVDLVRENLPAKFSLYDIAEANALESVNPGEEIIYG